MDEATFWQLVDRSRTTAGGVDEQAERLDELLRQRDASEVVGFARQFHEHTVRANHWDLWAVAYLALGGCSDDGFDYFRAWLIGQGREAYRQVLVDPDALAGLPTEDEEVGAGEDLIGVAWAAHRALTGEDLPDDTFVPSGDPAGERFDGDDWEALRTRFPRTAARFDEVG